MSKTMDAFPAVEKPEVVWRRNMRLFWILLTTLFLNCGMLFAQGQEEAAPKVTIAAAYTEELTQEASFVGRGEAFDKTDLVAQVAGTIVEIAVADGAPVDEGDLIFRIEPDTYEAQVVLQQASVQRALANVQLAQIELQRKAELRRRDTIAQSELDIAQANAGIAEADLAAARAALQQAELDLKRTEIRAPFDGRIGRTNVSPGTLVSPSSGALTTLVRTNPMYVRFSLSEPQLLRVLKQLDTSLRELIASSKSPNVFVELPGGIRLTESGTVVFLDNRIDPATGTIALRAEFPNARGLILDGGFVTVVLEALEPTLSVLIPQNAVQRDQRGDFVLVVSDQQRVEQRYVQLGTVEGTAIVVDDGLREGESVIVEGLQRVRPGVEVSAVLAGTGN